MTTHTCRKCKCILTKDNSNTNNFRHRIYICKTCYRTQQREIRIKYPETYNILKIRDKINRSNNRAHPMEQNRTCSLYLGVCIAENVLSKVFKNVKRMPPSNQGYDFICSKGMKIDVKSSCELNRDHCTNYFQYNIKKNKTPDYFLCLGFDNRDTLTPMHMWLIPGLKLNTQHTASISESKLHKWDEYRLPIDKVVSCCEVLKA